MEETTVQQPDTQKPSRYWFGFVLIISLAIAVFIIFFDINILNPSNIDWLMAGDLGQHFTGWHAFRYDQWHFPLTLTKLLGWPQGVPIVFTDSNPVLALPFKIIGHILPEPFQYIGGWYLACLVLQGIFAYRLIFRITGNAWFAFLAATVFILYPPLLARFIHDTLMGHWLIIWVITLFIPPYSEHRIWLQGLALIILSAAVHLYLTAMILPLIIGAVLFGSSGRISNRFWIKSGVIFLMAAVLISEMIILGYFSVEAITIDGYGIYSMNLNAPFNPLGWSAFLKGLPITFAQYEGFQYLGLGSLLLLAIAAIVYGTFFYRVKKGKIQLQKSISVKPRVCFLLCYAVMTTLFAVSSTVMLGDRELVSFVLPQPIATLANTFRSSGRFFWPVAYLVFTGAFIVLWTKGRRVAIPVLGLVVLIQIIDIWPLRNYIHRHLARATRPAELISSLKPFIPKADIVYVANDVHVKRTQAIYYSTLLAAPYGVPLVSVYSARPNINHIAWEKEFRQQLANEDTSTKNVLAILPAKNFSCLPRQAYIHVADWFIMLPERADAGPGPGLADTVSEDGSRLTEVVKSCQSDCALIIAAKDEAAKTLPELFVRHMQQHGSHIDKLGFRDAYIAVLENGELRYEAFSQQSLYHQTFLMGKPVTVRSEGFLSGNSAAIRIEGRDYAPNRRGLNIVVLNSGQAPQAFHFDTHRKSCY